MPYHHAFVLILHTNELIILRIYYIIINNISLVLAVRVVFVCYAYTCALNNVLRSNRYLLISDLFAAALVTRWMVDVLYWGQHQHNHVASSIYYSPIYVFDSMGGMMRIVTIRN